MGRNFVLEGVLSTLNEKQNAEGSYLSSGPAVTPLSYCKQVTQDVL